jgi:hypothetical protein
VQGFLESATAEDAEDARVNSETQQDFAPVSSVQPWWTFLFSLMSLSVARRVYRLAGGSHFNGARGDLLIAGVLWAVGFCVGSWYIAMFNRIGGVADFGQPEFGAAVAWACGKGFVNPGSSAATGLGRFLGRESDAFSCEELITAGGDPAHGDSGTIDSGALTLTQRLYRYLMAAVAVVWRVRGVSWSGLWPLFGILFGSTIASAYGLFRLGIGRPLSIAASLALVVSAVHLSRLPYLRDYAKAPFMLALLLVMARMAVGPLTVRRIIGHAMVFGAILGIGLGFRNDLMINVPPFVAVVLLCLPGKVIANLRLKAAAIALAAVTFSAVAWPIVRGYGAGSNTGHVAVLGLMTPFDKPLGIRGSLYDWGYAYVDQFAANIINSHSYRLHGYYVHYLSKEYDREAIELLLQIVRHWPADILARLYGSVLKVVELPFTVGTYANAVPFAATGDRMADLYGWQIWLLYHYLSGRGLLMTVLALLMISARSTWAAAALLVFLIYYAGYPAIQFDVRHFFHLEFIAWWALAYTLQQVGVLASALVRGNSAALRAAVQLRRWAKPAARMGAFAIVAGAVVLGTLKTLRAYQARHVRSMLRERLAAPRQRLETTVAVNGGKAFITSAGLWALSPQETPSMPVWTRYLIAEFSPGSCDAVQLPVTFRYRYEHKVSDFSRTVILNLMPHGGPIVVFFPAYRDRNWSSSEGPSGSSFDGIELPSGHAGCMTALYRMPDLSRYPVLVGVTLAPGWEKATPYQTLSAFEQPDTGDGPTFYTVPRELLVTRSAFEDRVRSISDEMTERARIASVAHDGVWTARGRPDGPQSTLLRFRPRRVPRGALLIVQGELRRGGVSIGLFTADRRRVTAAVTTPGPFVVVLEAPDEGDFSATVANDIVPWWPASRIGRRVGPLVEWIPGATLQTDVVVKRIGWATMVGDRADGPVKSARSPGE